MIFDDPLSAEFQENSMSIKEESMSLLKNRATKTPKVRVPREKFYMSLELKGRINELLKRQIEENIVSKICKKILNLKTVSLDSINYLGLSNDDFSKISYITPERYERVKDKTFVEKYVTHKTKIIINTKTLLKVYKEDGSDHVVTNERQYCCFFKRGDIRREPTKTIKLDRIKKYNSEKSQEEGFPVYDFEYRLPQNNTRYYLTPSRGITVDNGNLISQYGNGLDSWFFLDLKEKEVKAVWDYTLRYHQSIHKILNKLFPNEFTEREKNIFAEHYFKLVVPTKKGLEFKVVDSEELKHYYLENNYKKPQNSSTLWQSCMRYDNTQKYLDFYLSIPGVKLAVLKENGGVTARCLLWYVDEKIYYDRIYYYNEEALAFMENYLDSVGFHSLRTSHCSGIQTKHEIDINLSEDVFQQADYYPYLDSLRFYYPSLGILTNGRKDMEDYYTLERIDGRYDQVNAPDEDEETEEYCCELCDYTTQFSDDLSTIGIGRARGSEVCSDCGVWSEVYNETILSEDSYYCTYSETYVLDSEICELYNGDYCYASHPELNEYENNYGHFLLEQHEYIEHSGSYYHPEDPEIPTVQEAQVEEEENNII